MPEPTGHDATGHKAPDIRTWRQTHGFTQRSLAAALGIHWNVLARWERGELAIAHPGILQLALDHLARNATPEPATKHEPSA